jgi:hypothetical protein
MIRYSAEMEAHSMGQKGRLYLVAALLAVVVGSGSVYAQKITKSVLKELKKYSFAMVTEDDTLTYFCGIMGTEYFAYGQSAPGRIDIAKSKCNSMANSIVAFKFGNEELAAVSEDPIILRDEYFKLFRNKFTAEQLNEGVGAGGWSVKTADGGFSIQFDSRK